MTRAATIARGILALALLAALAGGIPWALWHFVGWPLPHHLPGPHQLSADLSQHGIADATLLKALACVVWVAWAVLVASLAVEIPAAVRGRTAAHLAVAGPLQPVIGQLLAAIAIAALSLGARPTSSGPQPLAAALGGGRGVRSVPAVAMAGHATPAAFLSAFAHPAAPPSPPAASAADDGVRSYVVARNDTLWGIAERELGDPLRWRDIYTLNQARPQPGGARLADPHWIDPGWTLLLPAGPPTVAGPPDPAPEPADPPPTSAPIDPPPATPPLASDAAPLSTQTPHVPAQAGQHDTPVAPHRRLPPPRRQWICPAAQWSPAPSPPECSPP